MEKLSEIFGIEITNESLFKKALTHSSYTKANDLPQTDCYERLEFLGDAVLKLSISDVLMKKYPTSPEGELSKIRGIVVSDNILADLAKKNGIKDLIILSKDAKKQHLSENDSVCACVFEALLGAFYLEGRFQEILKYIELNFTPYIEEVSEHFEKYNAKAILQEYTQGINKKTPEYRLVSETGPDHKKVFEIEVSYNGEVLATETGFTKKEAEQKCAYSACKKLGVI